VRITRHPIALALCLLAGPLTSTSANPSGARPALNAFQVRRYFGSAVDYVVNGRLGSLAGPTPIRDAETGAVVRPGRL